MKHTRSISTCTLRTAASAALLLFAIGHGKAQSLTTLHNFSGPDGLYPSAGLVQASDGNFYGTTRAGGATFESGIYLGAGTVFRMTPSGTVTTLHSFGSLDGDPTGARLVQASDGNLYGTTFGGGYGGDGTIFRIAADGTFTTLYTFNSDGSGSDGTGPAGGLIQGSDGALYGTTTYGGANYDPGDPTDYPGDGTTFRITTGGQLTTLHAFDPNNSVTYGDGTIHPEGANPLGALVQASDGSLYGVTANGADFSIGTVYRMTTAGALTELHAFTGGDGSNPQAGLTLASDGNLYGTTTNGGVLAGAAGTVFRITTAGALTSLYEFTDDATGVYLDGYYPVGELVQASDGNLYGTAELGGIPGYGTIFRITTAGALTTLHAFTGADGEYPYGGLVQAAGGNLYGTTSYGGTAGVGTTFVMPFQAASSPDATPPTTAAVFSGSQGSNGWYVGPVSVSLSAIDNLGGSGVAATYYSVDGGAWKTYAAPFTISGDAVHSLVYWSVDNAGNAEAQKSTTVRIDSTAPSVTAKTSPSSVKASSKLVAVTVSGAVADSVSGVDASSGWYQVYDSAGGSEQYGPFSISATGTYSFALSLSARTAKGTTRTYTIQVFANDLAGNTGSTYTTFTVKG